MGFLDSKSTSTATQQNAGFSEIGGNANSLNITGGGKKSNQTVNVYSTDAGALAAGRAVAEAALDSGFQTSRASLDLARDALGIGADLAGRSADQAFGFGADALGTVDRSVDALLSSSREANANVSDIARDSINAISSSSAQSLAEGLDFGRSAISGVNDALSSSLGAVGDLASESLRTVSDAQSGILDFARSLFDSVTESNRDTVASTITGLSDLSMQTSQSSDDRVAKIAGYALLAIVAAMLLPVIFKR